MSVAWSALESKRRSGFNLTEITLQSTMSVRGRWQSQVYSKKFTLPGKLNRMTRSYKIGAFC